ncbi:MAG: MATE family efflux transporter [Clostridiales bacterium]|nr:MATE family efflux transporter [Clostridiales bacterium]
MKKKKHDYLNKMIQLSWPVMIGMILQSFLGTVDLYFISKLGTVHTSALSIGANTFMIINVFATLVSTGVLSLSARRFGEGKFDEIKTISIVGIKLSIGLGVIMLIIFLGREASLVELLYKTDIITTAYIVDYLRIILIFIPFVFINGSLRSSMHAMGNTFVPLIIFGISNIVNIILDPIFIFNLKMGIKGAALATGISLIISTVLAIYFGFIKINGKVNVKDFFTCNNAISSQILRIGVWDSIQQIARPFTAILMFRIVYYAGKDVATAAFGIGGQLFGYTFIFLTGLSVAISILIGQKLGEGKKNEIDEILKLSFKVAAVNMLLFSIPYLVFPKWIYNIFTDDMNVIENGVLYLKIVYIGILFVIFPIVYGGALKGAGYTYGPMLASVTANVFFKVPIAYLLTRSFGFGVSGVWWAISISVLIEAIIIIIIEKKKDWKSIKL